MLSLQPRVFKQEKCLTDANIDLAVCESSPSRKRTRVLKQAPRGAAENSISIRRYLRFNPGWAQHMPIKSFEKGYTLAVSQRTIDELKFSYRSATSHIFKSIHDNKKIDLHLRNKINLRLFCCHMINRIFNQRRSQKSSPLHQLESMSAIRFEVFFFKNLTESSMARLHKSVKLYFFYVFDRSAWFWDDVLIRLFEFIRQGKFSNNKRDGQGTFKWLNGEQYMGSWLKGLKSVLFRIFEDFQLSGLISAPVNFYVIIGTIGLLRFFSNTVCTGLKLM